MKFRPTALWRMRISPGPGSPTSTSAICNCSGPPGWEIWTALLMTVPPLLWAGNAVVGRLVNGMVPPITLNFLRWALALVLLLPIAGWVLRPGSGLWTHWRRFAVLGLLGVGCYNAL